MATTTNRRNTASKKLIMDLLEASDSALSQDVLEEKVKDKMDRVTIYRVLNRFCEDGVLHRFVSDEGKYFYALCRSCKENHHSHEHIHFQCLRCSRVECLSNKVNPRLPEGYSIVQSNYWISGYCKDCDPTKTPAPAAKKKVARKKG